MNEARRARIQCDIEQLVAVRERIHKIRDDEDRAIRGDSPHGPGSQEASDLLSEIGFVLMVAIGQLDKAKKAKNKEGAS